MAKTVVGLMDTSQEAEGVVRDLVATCGCDRADIGMMARGSQGEVSGGAGTSRNRGVETGSAALQGAGNRAAGRRGPGHVGGVGGGAIPRGGALHAGGPLPPRPTALH